MNALPVIFPSQSVQWLEQGCHVHLGLGLWLPAIISRGSHHTELPGESLKKHWTLGCRLLCPVVRALHGLHARVWRYCKGEHTWYNCSTLTVPSIVHYIDLLHIGMPLVMRGLTLTVPSLVNPIDLLHIYMPMIIRGLTLTVPSLMWHHIDLLYTSTCLYGNERGNSSHPSIELCGNKTPLPCKPSLNVYRNVVM